MKTGELKVFLKTITWETDGVISLELRPVSGEEFPPFTPGAHIDVHLPSGVTRSYSLTNSPSRRDVYEIAVQHEAASRGGSRFIHQNLRVGDVLEIAPPLNTFSLVEDAEMTIFIADGKTTYAVMDARSWTKLLRFAAA